MTGTFKLRNDFTGTDGYGKINKQLNVRVDKNFKGIKSYSELKNIIYNESGNRKSHYITLEIFMTNLNKYIENEYSNKIDPIDYLYFLYYTEKLTFEEIYDKLAHLGNYNNSYKDTFTNMYKNIFKWETRDYTEISDRTRKKIGLSTKKASVGKVKEKLNLVEKVENILKRISKDKIKNEIDSEVLKNQKNNVKRVSYIFESLGYIEQTNFEKTILTLKDKYGLKVTAEAVNNLLVQNGIKDLKFNKGRISEFKKEQ